MSLLSKGGYKLRYGIQKEITKPNNVIIDYFQRVNSNDMLCGISLLSGDSSIYELFGKSKHATEKSEIEFFLNGEPT